MRRTLGEFEELKVELNGSRDTLDLDGGRGSGYVELSTRLRHHFCAIWNGISYCQGISHLRCDALPERLPASECGVDADFREADG